MTNPQKRESRRELRHAFDLQRSAAGEPFASDAAAKIRVFAKEIDFAFQFKGRARGDLEPQSLQVQLRDEAAAFGMTDPQTVKINPRIDGIVAVLIKQNLPQQSHGWNLEQDRHQTPGRRKKNPIARSSKSKQPRNENVCFFGSGMWKLTCLAKTLILSVSGQSARSS